MKRLLSLVLTLVLLLAVVCGCDDNKDKDKEKVESKPTTSSSDTQSTDVLSEELTSSDEQSPVESTTETIIETIPADSSTESEDTSSEEEEEKETPLRETLQGGVNFSCIDSGSDVKNIKRYIYDRKYYDLIAEAGFDHIRFPVGLGSFVVSEAPEYLLDNEALRYIDIAINHALDAGLVILLDNHHNSGYTEPEKFKRVWEQVAERYRYYPEELMFELVNEPTSANMSTSALNELQMQTVELIRKTNPTRTIALAPNDWNGAWKLWDCAVPSHLNERGQIEWDENVILSVHIYNTMSFTHQGMNGRAACHWTDEIAPSVTSALETCADYEKRTGRTVWISEWGAYQGGHRDGHGCMEKYYKHFTSECARLDLAYAVWEFNSGFGIFNSSTNEFYSYIVDNMVIEW